jgi:hypothetical protein
VSFQFLLTLAFIALGGYLHGQGKVEFWGMFAIMMLPNIAFGVLRRVRRRKAA